MFSRGDLDTGFYPLLLIQISNQVSRTSQPSIFLLRTHFLTVHRLILPSLDCHLSNHVLDTIYRSVWRTSLIF